MEFQICLIPEIGAGRNQSLKPIGKTYSELLCTSVQSQRNKYKTAVPIPYSVSSQDQKGSLLIKSQVFFEDNFKNLI